VRPCDLYESGKLGDLEARLMARFSPPLRPEHVQRCLVETVVRLNDARVRTYLPILIERAVTDQLQGEVRHQPSATLQSTRHSLVPTAAVRATQQHDHPGSRTTSGSVASL
jgi:hypothetical protein